MPGALSVYNMVDFAVDTRKDKLARDAAFAFNQYSPLMGLLTQKVDNIMDFESMRYTELQEAPGFVKINEDLPVINNRPTPYQEHLYAYGYSTQVPKQYTMDRRTGGLGAILRDKHRVAMKNHVMTLTEKIVNGRNTGVAGADLDANSFNGIRYRIAAAAGRAATGADSFMKVDATSFGAATFGSTFNSQTLANMLSQWDQMLFRMGNSEGDGVIILVNNLLLSRISNSYLLTQHSIFGDDTNALGKRVMTYRNAKIVCPGWTTPKTPVGGNRQAEILAPTETDNGEASTGGTKTSVFFIKNGEESFCMRKMKDDAPEPVNLRDGGLIYESIFLNFYGFEQKDPNAIGQIHNIDLA